MNADVPYVFLSYASVERERAFAIADALEAAGVPVWVDRQSIHGGASWSDAIVAGIRNCTVFTIACSDRALHSRNVKQEIQLAWRFEKPYLPLLLEPVEFPQQVLYFLEGWQWVELHEAPSERWLPPVLEALAKLGITAEASQRGVALPMALHAPAAAPPPLAAQRGELSARGPSGERRQVTAVVCELAGAALRAARRDPEDLQLLVHAFQRACIPVIEQFGGYVAQNRGDSLLVYFGYPAADEDDARRAVRAALAVADALQEGEPATGGIAASAVMRLGIHTGLVVVDRDGAGQVSFLGETPAVAARLPSLAPDNGVVISAATERLVRGHVLCEPVEAAGTVGGAGTVFRVTGATGAGDRLDAAGPEGLTPLVGRGQELALLLESWQRVVEGQGQAVLLSGEPGIGKSRLVRAVREQLAKQPHERWECRCSTFYQHSALYPLIDFFQRALELSDEAPPEERFTRLEQRLLQFGLLLPEAAPLFAALLGLPMPARYPPLNLSPERQRQRTLEAIVGLLLAASEQQPLLFVVEDLHWADPTTLELLGLVLEQAPAARLLVLLTARPEFVLPWPAQAAQLRLERLPARQAELLAERVAGNKPLPDEVLRQVAARTDGVPLFVEELTRMLLESGLLREGERGYELTAPLPAQAIPATLADSLMARLDRLGAAKAVAQLGAVLGRSFTHALLQAVSALDETALQAALRRLLEAGLVLRRGVGGQVTYLFKHALVQDAAYQSLLRSTRQQYHRQIAAVLEAQFAAIVAAQPELVAHHYTEAGMVVEAVPYWQRAGEQAFARSAHAEAIAHLQRGLELVATLPDTPERARLELSLQLAIGPVYMNVGGYGAAHVASTFARARELSEALGDVRALLQLLYFLWTTEVIRAHHTAARELSDQYVRLAESHGDPSLLISALLCLRWTHAMFGELEASRAAARRLLALHDPVRDAEHIAVYGQDQRVIALATSAWVDWLFGYPDEATEAASTGVTSARELSHPYSLAFAIMFAAIVCSFCGVDQTATDHIEELDRISSEHGFAWSGVWATILAGDSLVENGQADQGAGRIKHGLAALQASREMNLYPFGCTLLAAACLKAGCTSQALDALKEALATIAATGEVCFEAEVYRLRGAALQPDDEAAAERDFLRALEIARGQQAKSLELRAATSLARLRQAQGKTDQARQVLAEVYGWFTGGFDTRDLVAAKALLDELT